MNVCFVYLHGVAYSYIEHRYLSFVLFFIYRKVDLFNFNLNSVYSNKYYESNQYPMIILHCTSPCPEDLPSGDPFQFHPFQLFQMLYYALLS